MSDTSLPGSSPFMSTPKSGRITKPKLSTNKKSLARFSLSPAKANSVRSSLNILKKNSQGSPLKGNISLPVISNSFNGSPRGSSSSMFGKHDLRLFSTPFKSSNREVLTQNKNQSPFKEVQPLKAKIFIETKNEEKRENNNDNDTDIDNEYQKNDSDKEAIDQSQNKDENKFGNKTSYDENDSQVELNQSQSILSTDFFNMPHEVCNDGLKLENNSLKYQLASLKNEIARSKIQYEDNLRQLEGKIKSEGARADASERDQSFLYERYSTLSNTYEETSKKLSDLESEYMSKVTKSQQEVSTLREELTSTINANEELQEKMNREKRQQNLRINTLENGMAECQKEIERYITNLSSANNTIALKEGEIEKLRDCLSSYENSGLGNFQQAQEEIVSLRKQVSEHLSDIHKLEAQNAHYKGTNEELIAVRKELQISQEKIWAAESKLSQMEELRIRAAEYELQAAELKDEQEKWKAYLKDKTNGQDGEVLKTPEDVVKALVQSRAETISALEKLGRILAENSARASSIKGASEDTTRLQISIKEIQGKLDKEVAIRLRAERQRDLKSREVGFLRTQLKSYEDETLLTKDLDTNSEVQKYKEQINHLELLINDYEVEIKKLTETLTSLSPVNAISKGINPNDKKEKEIKENEMVRNLLQRNDDLNKQVEQAEVKIKEYEIEVEALKRRITTAEDSAKVRERVLELRENPGWKDQFVKRELLKALQEENEALLAESKKAGSKSVKRMQLEKRELEKEIESRDKRIKRLKEIFAAKSLEFRDSVYSLLGFKLDFLPNNTVRATSMYSEKSEINVPTFIFDPEKGTMKLQGHAASEDCTNLIKFWVQERLDIPCFFSALNLELYEKTHSN